jgi:hypothetical protein
MFAEVGVPPGSKKKFYAAVSQTHIVRHCPDDRHASPILISSLQPESRDDFRETAGEPAASSRSQSWASRASRSSILLPFPELLWLWSLSNTELHRHIAYEWMIGVSVSFSGSILHLKLTPNKLTP